MLSWRDRGSNGAPARLAVQAVLTMLATFATACGGSDVTPSQPGDVPQDGAVDVYTDLPGEVPLDVLFDTTPDNPGPDDSGQDTTGPVDTGPDDLGPTSLLPPLPLRVEGRNIVDATGHRVRLQGVNWDGGHQEDFVPYGLDYHTPAEIAGKLRKMGFNSVRLTYSDRMVRDDPVPPDGRLAANPSLQGKGALATFDAVVNALAAEGILIILNNHTSDATWCCSLDDDNYLWHNSRFSEADWMADWVKLIRRYRDVPALVGADLRNEPRQPAQWGTGGGIETDWPSAAERCGTALLAENPDLVILVEGVVFANDLSGAAARPVNLPAAHLAYSAHDYGWALPASADTYDDFAMVADSMWGYLLSAQPPSPVWLGEFGCFHREIGNKWWPWISRYIAERELDWSLWTIFAYGGWTWGLLDPITLEPADRAFWESVKALMTPEPIVPIPEVEPIPDQPVEDSGPASDAEVIETVEGPGPEVQWVTIPGGTLRMGATDLGLLSQPVLDVTVPSFRIGRTEVTAAQYAACVTAAACTAPNGSQVGDDAPVQWVTWDQSKAFCAWAGGQLCTEAQWELAAGNGSMGSRYPWGNQAPTCADAVWNGPGCLDLGPANACSRPAGNNVWGLCDLAGNVMEWVEDDWHASHLAAPTNGSAWVDDPRSSARVLKGGGFAHNFADGLRTAWRDRGMAGDNAAMFGTRCCGTPAAP